MTQPDLYSPLPVLRCDQAAPAQAKKRLSRQCADILEMFRRGPVSLRQLSDRASQYNARIYELRHRHGYNIQCISHDEATGETWYALLPGEWTKAKG